MPERVQLVPTRDRCRTCGTGRPLRRPCRAPSGIGIDYKAAMTKTTTPLVARPKRPPCVLICAKCVKKAENGRAIRKAVKAELSQRAMAAGRRPGKLIETRCMGLCPKRALTLASGATLARGELLVVKGTADVPAALEALLR